MRCGLREKEGSKETVFFTLSWAKKILKLIFGETD